MENRILERKSLDFLTNEKVDFYSSFDEIAHKISQILPFSKLLLISTDNDFFDFASQLFNKLSSLGLKVVNIIYNQNVSGQIEDLIEDYPFEDHRGIITFSKTVLFKLNQNCVKIEKIFFVQKQLDTYGIFFNFNGIKNKNIHYILCDRLFDEQYAKKSFAIKTVHLIDYVFRNQLLNQRADTIFFLSQKKKLVNALMALKSFCLNKQMLFRLNLELENSICKSIYPFGAINVCTFLFCKDFFEFKSAFHFSNALIQKLKGVLSGKIVEEKIGAKIVLKALTMPVRQIAKNAGVDDGAIVEKLMENENENFGYNALTNEFCDMLKEGIIDPVKVTRTALECAGSVASTLLTTECIVVQDKSKINVGEPNFR